jgi:hypothetical protein
MARRNCPAAIASFTGSVDDRPGAGRCPRSAALGSVINYG